MNRLTNFQYEAQKKMSGITLKVISKLGLTLLLVTAIVMLQDMEAHAAPFSSDVTISGSISYDTAYALSRDAFIMIIDPPPMPDFSSATFYKTVGGVTTSSTATYDVLPDPMFPYTVGHYIANHTVNGPNPQSGTLTDLGDGFGMSARAGERWWTSGYPSSWGVRMDLLLNIKNNSLTDPYLVTFDLTFDNYVYTEGPANDAHVVFSLFDSTNNEIFFTDLYSSGWSVNAKNRVPTGQIGGIETDSGIFSFNTLLGPGASSFYTGTLTMDVWHCGWATENTTFNADLTVTDVELVPVPGAFLLGILGLSVAGMKLRKHA